MAFLVCSRCNTVDHSDFCKVDGPRVLCTCCKPGDGKWHNHFPKETYDPKVHRVENKPNNIGLS